MQITGSKYFCACFLFFVFIFCGAMASRQERLVIVKDGKPNARIVVGDDVSPSAKFAAKELADYVFKSTGAKLPFSNELIDDGKVEIVIGAGELAKSLGVDTKVLTRDAFRIKTIGRRIFILGIDDPKMDVEASLTKSVTIYGWKWHGFEHATIFGVYDFLERYVGVRWYLPIDIGEVVPKTKTIIVPEIDIEDSPKKMGRFIHTYYGADDRDDPYPKKVDRAKRGYEGYRPGFEGKENEEFVKRRNLFFMRMRHETNRSVGNHTMFRLISPEQFGESHPEFFALSEDGTRAIRYDSPAHAQHCFSNEEMINILIEDAKALFRGESAESRGIESWNVISRQTPWGPAFHVMQDDEFEGCRCEKCLAAKTPGLEGSAAYSELIWSAVFKIADGIREEFPNCVISVGAYGPLENPPSQPLPDNLIIGGMAKVGPYEEFLPELKKWQEERLEKWLDKIEPEKISFYNYSHKGSWENGRYRGYEPIPGSVPRSYASYYQKYADIGNGTYLYLLSHRFAYDHLNTYVFYKYHWSPNLDIDQMLDEYYRLFYGPAAEPMKKFWDQLEEKFRQSFIKFDNDSWWEGVQLKELNELWKNVYTRQTVNQWLGYFKQAEKLAAEDEDDIYSKRIAYMKRNVMDSIEQGLLEYEKDKDREDIVQSKD